MYEEVGGIEGGEVGKLHIKIWLFSFMIVQFGVGKLGSSIGLSWGMKKLDVLDSNPSEREEY